MKNKTLEPKTDTRTSPSPYQAERAEAQETPVFRPDPLGATLAPPGSETTVRAHAAGLNRATARRALRRLQLQYGNRYVQRVVELAQRRGSGEGFQLDDETAGRINRARGGGQPLDGVVQARMSEAMGFDFSGVQVHTGSEANELNQQLSAKAFTTGRDIFFRQGEYNPGSGNGRKLIAHELTHVVQQSSGRVHRGRSGMTVRPAGDAFEQEAETLGRRAARGSIESTLQRAVVNPAITAPDNILALRRSYGNKAVERLLAQLEGGKARYETAGETVGKSRTPSRLAASQFQAAAQSTTQSQAATVAGQVIQQALKEDAKNDEEWVYDTHKSAVAAFVGHRQMEQPGEAKVIQRITDDEAWKIVTQQRYNDIMQGLPLPLFIEKLQNVTMKQFKLEKIKQFYGVDWKSYADPVEYEHDLDFAGGVPGFTKAEKKKGARAEKVRQLVKLLAEKSEGKQKQTLELEEGGATFVGQYSKQSGNGYTVKEIPHKLMSSGADPCVIVGMVSSAGRMAMAHFDSGVGSDLYKVIQAMRDELKGSEESQFVQAWVMGGNMSVHQQSLPQKHSPYPRDIGGMLGLVTLLLRQAGIEIAGKRQSEWSADVYLEVDSKNKVYVRGFS